VSLDGMDYIAHGCLDLLVKGKKQHASMGGTLAMGWGGLQARFGRRILPAEPEAGGSEE
jgi:hypothetical protein